MAMSSKLNESLDELVEIYTEVLNRLEKREGESLYSFRKTNSIYVQIETLKWLGERTIGRLDNL